MIGMLKINTYSGGVMKQIKHIAIAMTLLVTTGLFITTKKIDGRTKNKGKEMSQKEPHIDIDINARKISIKILNKLLADEFVLLVQTLNYHWNIVGPQFNDYHKLFNDQYNAIFEIIDGVAERTRSIGGVALGTMAQFIKESHLKEDSTIPAPKEMVKKLLAQHESLIRALRKGVNETAIDDRDMGTNNHLTDVLEKHEKMSWMLRSLTE